jgi:copper transport protein
MVNSDKSVWGPAMHGAVKRSFRRIPRPKGERAPAIWNVNSLMNLRRYGVGLFLGLLVAFLVVGFQSSPASAHSEVVTTSPDNGAVLDTAPSAVTVTFTEPVNPVADQVRVFAPNGKRVDRGEPKASGPQLRIGLQSVGDGTYLVSYRVTSADGHPVAGGFSFSIGEPSATPAALPGADDDPTVEAALSVMRYTGFTGLVLLVGSVGMLLLAWPARLSRQSPGRLAWIGVGLVVASAVGELLLQVPYQFGGRLTELNGGMLWTVLDSRYGYAHLARIGLVLFAVPLIRSLIAQGRRRLHGVTLGGLMLAALATWSLSGHPSASSVPWLSTALDMAHLAAMSVWLGGLVVLVGFLLRRATREELGPLLPAWAKVAATSVAVLMAAGVVHTAMHVRSVAALASTEYGLLVLAKAAILVGILVVASFSRSLVLRGGSQHRLQRLISVELVFAAAVLAVTAVLVQTTPTRTAAADGGVPDKPASGRVSETLASELYELRVEIRPTRVGHNEVHLTATTPDDKPLKVAEWKATAALPGQDIPPIPVAVKPMADDHATGEITLPTAGRWEFRFTLRISEIDQETVSTAVTVG